MLARLWLLLVLAILLPGCGNLETNAYDALLDKIVDKDEDTLSRHFVDVIRKEDYTTAQEMLSPEMRGAQADAGLRKLHTILDQGEPVDWKLIGYNFWNKVGSATSHINITYQIQFHHAWVAGDVLLLKTTEGTLVLGCHFQPIRDSLAVLYQFSLADASPLQYSVFFLVIAIPLFILYALVLCIRTHIRRKWLWIIFIIFGIGAFKFNWSTQAHEIQPLTINLFGCGFFRSGPYAPYIFDLGLPLGAAIFLLRRKHLRLPVVPPPQPQ